MNYMVEARRCGKWRYAFRTWLFAGMKRAVQSMAGEIRYVHPDGLFS